MPATFTIDAVNFAEFERYLKDLPEEIFDDGKKVFKKAVLDAQSQVESNFGPKLKSRTGVLKRSINTSVSGKDIDSLEASLYGSASAKGSQMVYTLMQEYGGEVVAKNAYRTVPGGPYLNIPTRSNKTAAGVMRLGPREVFRQGGYIAKTKKNQWGVFLKGQMMFVLVKKVTIPAQLGMREAAEDQVPTILSRLQNLIGEN